MGRITKSILFTVIVLIFLLVACAPSPAPVVTQDPALVQQLIEQSVALTLAVERSQATEQQASVVTQPSTPVPEPVDELPDVSEAPTQEAVPVDELPDVSEAPTQEAVSVDELPELEVNCILLLQDVLGMEESEIKNLESQLDLEVHNKAVIVQKVNLRTGPSLKNRIILTLKKDTPVEIKGGPVETNYQNGATYIWWQVQIPGGMTGWSVEISLCRQFYFMVPIE